MRYEYFLGNWKTTTSGVAGIVFAIVGMALGKINYTEGAAMIIAGIGLFLAKDADKTGVK